MKESHKIETKPARVRTEWTGDLSLADFEQSECVNEARQSEDGTTSDSQSVSVIPKKWIHQSDDLFTFNRRSEDIDDQSDDEESTESENWVIEIDSLEYCSNRTLKD